MLDKLISLFHILGWAGIKFAQNQGGTSLPGSLAGDYWKCKSGCNSRNFAVCVEMAIQQLEICMSFFYKYYADRLDVQLVVYGH